MNKPTFLDRAPRYTRLTRRTVEYACAVDVPAKGYPPLWWKYVIALSVVALVVIWVTR